MGKLKTTRKRRTYRKINKKKVKKTRNRRKQSKTRRTSKHRKKKGGFSCYKKCYPFVTNCGPGKKCSMLPNVGISCPSLVNRGPGWCVAK